jgi:hypothetical protein
MPAPSPGPVRPTPCPAPASTPSCHPPHMGWNQDTIRSTTVVLHGSRQCLTHCSRGRHCPYATWSTHAATGRGTYTCTRTSSAPGQTATPGVRALVPACHRVGGVTAVSAQVVGGSGGALSQTPWPKCRLNFLSAPHSKACCPRCLSIAQGHLVLQKLGVAAVHSGRTSFADIIAAMRALKRQFTPFCWATGPLQYHGRTSRHPGFLPRARTRRISFHRCWHICR